MENKHQLPDKLDDKNEIAIENKKEFSERIKRLNAMV
jgi:hypothetical protein